MNKSEVQYWIKRYDIKYQQNKENYDKLKECEHQLQSYKQKEDKIRELIKATPLPSSDYMENLTTMFMFKKDILDILNEGE